MILCVDASGKSAAAAVAHRGKLLAEGFENNGFTHSQTLLPLIADTLQKAGVTIDRIEAFAVTNGPGSFTGLRIGCALVKGMAGARPCIGVPTLLALAYNAIDENAVVIPMMDARCHQVYTATFEAQNGNIKRLGDDRAIAVSELCGDIKAWLAQGRRVLVLGDGAYLLPDDISVESMPEEKRLILGRSVARAAAHLPAGPADQLGLNYLRLSQAEREKNLKNGGKKI